MSKSDPTSAPPAPSIESEPVELSTPYSLARAVRARKNEFIRPRKIRVKIGTWNVAACPGTDKDLARWFVDGRGIDQDLNALDLSQATAVNHSRPNYGSSTSDIGLYVLGLQEVVDLNMTKEYMARTIYTDNSAKEKWQTAIEAALPKGYELVVAEQMFGLLLLAYASPDIAPTISNVSTKQVGTGLGGWFANKGAVATRIVLGETARLVFVNCHLASGETAANLDRRCADAAQILAKTQFDPIVHAGVEEDDDDTIGEEDFAFWLGDLNYRLDGLPGDDIRRLLTLHAKGEYGQTEGKSAPPEGEGIIVLSGSDSDDDTAAPSSSSRHSRDESFDTSSSLPDPDEFPEDPSQDPASLQATLNSLLPHDQLGQVMQSRKAFYDGWREGPITFLPTYKYDLGTVGLFDTSEKQRAPSWCDRILYRTRRDRERYEEKAKEEVETKKKDEEMKSRGLEEDDDVLFTYDPDMDGEENTQDPSQQAATPAYDAYDAYDEYDENENQQAEDTANNEDSDDPIRMEFYTSHQRITSSDHKPVSAGYTLEYEAVVPELKTVVHSEVARELDRAENEGRPNITIITEAAGGSDENAVDIGQVQFLERKSCYLTVANTGGVSARFAFVDKPKPDEETGDGLTESSEWLTTSFMRTEHGGNEDDNAETLGKSVTLEPGETVLAVVTVYVTSIPVLRAFNEGRALLEDVLVLRVEEGRDYFLTVRGTWLPSCFGRSVDELIRVPDGGIRHFVKEWNIQGSIPYDAEQKFSAPKELFNIMAAMESLAERCVADEAMTQENSVPKNAGWPLEESTWTAPASTRETLLVALVDALDTDKPLLAALPIETSSSHKLEALSSVLIIFLSGLTDGLIPHQLWLKLAPILPTSLTQDVKSQTLETLSSAPTHNIAFVFLTTALSRVTSELSPINVVSSPTSTTSSLSRRISFRRTTTPATTAAAATQEARKRRRASEKRFAEIVAPVVCRSSAAVTSGQQQQQQLKDKQTREKERILLEAYIRPDDESI